MPRTAEGILTGKAGTAGSCAAHANVVYSLSSVFHMSQAIIFEVDVTISSSIQKPVEPRLMS
jgi:hypothetical protein